MGLDVFGSIRSRRLSGDSGDFQQSFSTNLGDVVRSVGVLNAREGRAPVDGTSPARDWDALIAQVRTAAQQAVQPGSGEAEARLRQREIQAQNLLRSAHRRLDEANARMAEADEKVRLAEDRARAAEVRAAAMIEAAERRAGRAETAARSALDWLQRLRQAGPASVVAPPKIDAAPHLFRRVA